MSEFIGESPEAGDAGAESAGAVETGEVFGAGEAAAESTAESGAAGEVPAAAGDAAERDADSYYDKIFGLEAEVKETQRDQGDEKDVQTAPDPPAPRQSGEVEKEAGKDPGGERREGDAGTDRHEKPQDTAGRLDWKTAPKQFREVHEELNRKYFELLKDAPATKFVQEPEEFAKWMKETSPTSYSEVGRALATESANEHPREWAEYLIAENPDLVAEAVSGREGMTLERLRAELEVILDDDDADVKAVMERRRAETQAPEKEETPEQREIREWRMEREREARAAVYREVFTPIEAAIDSLVSESGLGLEMSSIEGKRFSDLDEETQFKVVVNELIPVWIDKRVKETPELVSIQERLNAFLEKKDAQSARALQHPVKIAATNFAAELLGVMTNARARAKNAETQRPDKDGPRPVVRSAGRQAATAAVSDDGAIDWSGRM